MSDDTMTPAEALAKGWASALGMAASLCRERERQWREKPGQDAVGKHSVSDCHVRCMEAQGIAEILEKWQQNMRDDPTEG